MRLASEGIFALRFPDHPLSVRYRRIAGRLIEATKGEPVRAGA